MKRSRNGPTAGGSFQSKFGQRILKTSGDGSYVRLHAPASRERQGGAPLSREALKQQQRERQQSAQNPENLRKDFGNAGFASRTSVISLQTAGNTGGVPNTQSLQQSHGTIFPPVQSGNGSFSSLGTSGHTKMQPLPQNHGQISSVQVGPQRPVVQVNSPSVSTFTSCSTNSTKQRSGSYGISEDKFKTHADSLEPAMRPSLADLQDIVASSYDQQSSGFKAGHYSAPTSSASKPFPSEVTHSQINIPRQLGGQLYGYSHMKMSSPGFSDTTHAYRCSPHQVDAQPNPPSVSPRLVAHKPQGSAYDSPNKQSQRGNERQRRRDPDVFAEEKEEAKERPTKDEANERLIKNEKDQLFFSRKHRNVSYKPCTTKEYLKNKPDGYYELGKLQVDLNTEEMAKKREKMERMKSYSSKLRNLNNNPVLKQSTPALASSYAIKQSPGANNQEEDELANQTRRVYHKQAPDVREQALREKRKAQSARHRALEFAKSVPKPRVRATKTARGESDSEGDTFSPQNRSRYKDKVSGKVLSELERLELEHDRAREEIEAIRKDFLV